MEINNKRIESAKNALATAASIAASAMVARSFIDQFLPCEIRDYISSLTNSLWARPSSDHTIIIREQEDYCQNKIYDSVSTYLATIVSTSLPRLRVSRVDHNDQNNKMTLSVEHGEELIDMFQGAKFKWLFRSHNESRSNEEDSRSEQQLCSYELTFDRKYKDMVLASYLPYIEDRAQEINLQNRKLKLHTSEYVYWRQSVEFNHPITFDTLAMDLKLKQMTMEDLTRFVKRKDYYKKIGKAWKRGYLLYGPPGTGKSSLIAAMANYLKFDVYDLELTGVEDNNTLRRLLLGTANKSIIVVEDIDCSVEIKERDDEVSAENSSGNGNAKLTLSGLLNFVDGLWSCCGEERIFVFTTNYKDRIDQALLRPGRMDMHIHMGYCSMSAVQMLAMNYHDIDDHILFEKIEELIKEVDITPAEVAEEFMRSEDKEVVLRSLIEFMEEKKRKRLCRQTDEGKEIFG